MFRSLVALLTFTVALPSGAVSPPFIAVLEHPQCAKDQARAVRPLFARATQGWTAVADPSIAAALPSDWVIVSVDVPARSVHTHTPAVLPDPEWTYTRDFLLKIASEETPPEYPNSSQQYAGWCDAPTNRPLLLVSSEGGPRARPRSLPRPNAPPPSPSLLRAFNASLGQTKLCEKYDDPQPVELTSSDLEVAQYVQVQGGARLAAVTLRRGVTECGSELGGIDLPRWFLLDKSVRFIGASLSLVGAVDFDYIGESAYVFWYSGYDEDGYVLFSKRFTRSARFTWKYH